MVMASVWLPCRSAGSIRGSKLWLTTFLLQFGTDRGRVALTSKSRSAAYWTTTGLVAFFIGTGGVGQIVQYHANPRGAVPLLGYPLYFFGILGFWKICGALTILAPRFPRLKEWAYAGIFFDLTGAAASCVAVGGYGAYGFHVLAPLLITVFTVVSWALRPQDRILGTLAQT